MQKKGNIIWLRQDVIGASRSCQSGEYEDSCLALEIRSRCDHVYSMLRRHGELLSVKIGRSNQRLRFKMGQSSTEFVHRANGIKGRANGDRRSREKTDGCLRPIRQQKRYAILLAYANGTEHLGVLPHFTVEPRISQRWASGRQQGESCR